MALTALAELVCSPTVAKRRVVLSLRRPAAGLVLVGLAFVAGAASNASAQETITIPVGDSWFCSSSYQGGVCETVIDAGDTVSWDFSGATIPHTTTDCGASCDSPSSSPLWDSDTVNNGGTYAYTFTDPGTYLYYCQIHPAIQRGRIVVQAAPVETPPTQPPPVADYPAPATNTPGTGLPRVGQGPDGASSAAWWLPGALTACAISLALASLGLRRVARHHNGGAEPGGERS